jgi:hypothetical protein
MHRHVHASNNLSLEQVQVFSRELDHRNLSVVFARRHDVEVLANIARVRSRTRASSRHRRRRRARAPRCEEKFKPPRRENARGVRSKRRGDARAGAKS